jgi:hypothetical protein
VDLIELKKFGVQFLKNIDLRFKGKNSTKYQIIGK